MKINPQFLLVAIVVAILVPFVVQLGKSLWEAFSSLGTFGPFIAIVLLLYIIVIIWERLKSWL